MASPSTSHPLLLSRPVLPGTATPPGNSRLHSRTHALTHSRTPDTLFLTLTLTLTLSSSPCSSPTPHPPLSSSHPLLDPDMSTLTLARPLSLSSLSLSASRAPFRATAASSTRTESGSLFWQKVYLNQYLLRLSCMNVWLYECMTL